MAADQRKKRLNADSLTDCTSRVNRKKLRVQKHDINVRPNISLEWDNKKKSVVSKREQIGIKRRHLNPFLEPGVPCHNVLADAFSVPQQLFQLENISDVLSYEVWQNHLSDNERRFLSQFLPNVSEPDIIVRDLLSGDNFHFGNPCVKWGASLCHGELHPDNILHEEQSLKAGKKVYYSDLKKYHSGMIENLRMWKEKWASCKDPEVDIVQNIWSSRQHGNEDNLVATPESCSWTDSEMACSNDNQNPDTPFGDSHRRNGLLGKISDNSSSGPKTVAAISKKVEHLHKHNIEHNDGAKYMFYIKVSREQRERVKSSMKHASNSIHSRSLNSVFGIDALNAQPYENFLDEEKKKLHQHWLKLATEDIPEGFANWEKRRLQRKELTLSLAEEIGQKLIASSTHTDLKMTGDETVIPDQDDNQDQIASLNDSPRQHVQCSDEMSFFNSYPSNNSTYHHHLMEAGEFPGHFSEQVHPTLALDLGQKRRSDNLYPHHHNIQGETMSHSSQNCWYDNSNAGGGVDNGTTQDGWLPSLSDQTLFSVLSECNELPPCDTVGLVQVGSYTSSSSGIGSSNFLQSNYLNGIARMSDDHLGWTGVVQPQQNSGIRDTSFLRSRNQ